MNATKQNLIIYRNKWDRLPLAVKERLLSPDTVLDNGLYLSFSEVSLQDRMVRRVHRSVWTSGSKTVAEYCVSESCRRANFLVIVPLNH